MSERSATPRPAATVILLRRSGRHSERSLEVLLVKRNPEARFMPGVWVFPGGAVDEDDHPGEGEHAEEEAHRVAAARELEEEAGIGIGAEAMLAWSRWITPEFEPGAIRFDTRFYVALSPPHSPPRVDGREVTEARWIDPGGALEAHGQGELPLVFPTIKHLEELTGFDAADAVLEAAGDREIIPIEPRVIRDEQGIRVAMPGEPGYED